MGDLIREIFAMVCLIVAVIMIMFVMFYDDIRGVSDTPVAYTYKMTPNQREIVREKENYMNSQNSILLTAGYTVDASDLSQYKSTGNLVTGQSSPFDEFVVTEVVYDAVGNTYYQVTSSGVQTSSQVENGNNKNNNNNAGGSVSGTASPTPSNQPESNVYKPSSDPKAPSPGYGGVIDSKK